MSNKELKELMSIICEGQDSEQRRKVENFIEYQVQLIDSLDKEIERLHSIIKEVREYIKDNMKIVSKEQAEDTRLPVGTFMWNVDNVLEILDKENNNE